MLLHCSPPARGAAPCRVEVMGGVCEQPEHTATVCGNEGHRRQRSQRADGTAGLEAQGKAGPSLEGLARFKVSCSVRAGS